jgi:hypothetical protein
MRSRKQSNLLNIGLIVFSICVVVFAIMTLNNFFFNRGKQTDVTANQKTSSVSYDAGYRGADFYLNKSATSATPDNTNTATNSSSSKNSSNSSKSNSGSSSSSTGSSTLAKGEALVKYLGGTDKNWDIIECNLDQIFYCKAGVKLTLGTNQKVEEGKSYKLTGGTISDTKEGLSLDSVDIVPVN